MIWSLRAGDLIRYIGETEKYFTHNQIYQVEIECDYEVRFLENVIVIRDDDFNLHCIGERYFENCFIVE